MFGLLWLRVDTPVDGILVFTEGVLRELKGEEKRRRQFGLAGKCLAVTFILAATFTVHAYVWEGIKREIEFCTVLREKLIVARHEADIILLISSPDREHFEIFNYFKNKEKKNHRSSITFEYSNELDYFLKWED